LLPTAVAGDQSQVRSCGICGGQSGTGEVFLQVLQVPLPILTPPNIPCSLALIRGWYNRLDSGPHTKWTQSHPTPRNKKKNEYISINLQNYGMTSSFWVNKILFVRFVVFTAMTMALSGATPQKTVFFKILFFCMRTTQVVTNHHFRTPDTPSKLWSFGTSCLIFRVGISFVQNTGTHLPTTWYHIQQDHDLDTIGGRVKLSLITICRGP
jgi:hypothetical protein